jgi:hypothetical protein
MLLLAAAVSAAPLAPSSLAGLGIEASFYGGTQRAWLREAGCTGGACDAWRIDTLVGAEVTVGLAKPVGLYFHGAWADEDVAAARYAADGYALGGGVVGRLDVNRLLGVHAWLGVEHQLTAADDLSEQVSAVEIDLGAVVRAGSVEDGFSAWIGGGVVPWADVRGSVVDGAVALTLAPRFPVEAAAGFQMASAPLFGPWNDRTRLAAGANVTVGYRTSLIGFISVLH